MNTRGQTKRRACRDAALNHGARNMKGGRDHRSFKEINRTALASRAGRDA